MALLGQIVAKVSGMPYEQYVQEKILKPMGLTNTRPTMPKELYGGALAKGYSGLSREGNRRLMPFFQANGIAAAAGFTSTVVDLGKFAQWQNRLYKSNMPEILKPSTLREMQRVQWYDPNGGANNWGLGFVVSNEGGRTIVGHGGSCPGYRSIIDLGPKSGIGVAVFSNAAGVSPEKFADGIFKILDKYSSTSASPTTVNLADFVGIYDATDWGSEAVVTPWKGRLLMYRLPSNDPLASPILPLFKPTATPNEFRFERKDDLPGVPLRFQRDAAGKVVSYTIHGNTTKKVR
jgi:CubicO group peptidase (beta-lactamase class C family)